MRTAEEIKEKFYEEFPHTKLDESPMDGARALGFLECIEFMVGEDMKDFVSNYKKIVMMKMVKYMLDDLSKR